MFLLDTNVVSELRKVRSGKADPGVSAWEAQTPRAQMYLSVVTLAELEHGVLRLEHGRDDGQAQLLRTWLEGVVFAFEDRILPIDEAVARRSAFLHLPDPRPFHDALIAATGLVHNLTVVTRNVKDFVVTGLNVHNPWS